MRLNTFTACFIGLCAAALMSGAALAQEETMFIFGDARPDAPELAPRGGFTVGVRTLTVTNPDQIDILNTTDVEAPARYDRTLTLEVWYPAGLADGQQEFVEYAETLGRADSANEPLVPFTFTGRAARDAEPTSATGPYPLLIVSHGFPGSRFMMTYLTENLASKGYVVVSIDHTESTFSDTAGFTSTLFNRSKDILFVLNQMAELGAQDSDSFLAGLVDANNTGLVGYSMGGYGVLNAAGAGYGAAYIPTIQQFGVSNAALFEGLLAGNADYAAAHDDRIKAAFVFAPWGMNVNLWDANSLAGLTVPLFVVVGSEDDVSGYENGPKAIYEGAVNAERYLLTFEGARHNVAPNPPPPEAVTYDQYMRYADSVWDSARMNNINQHFATAFFGEILQGQDNRRYLTLHGTDEWVGFPARSVVGMRFEHEEAGE